MLRVASPALFLARSDAPRVALAAWIQTQEAMPFVRVTRSLQRRAATARAKNGTIALQSANFGCR